MTDVKRAKAIGLLEKWIIIRNQGEFHDISETLKEGLSLRGDGLDLNIKRYASFPCLAIFLDRGSHETGPHIWGYFVDRHQAQELLDIDKEIISDW